MDVVGLVGSAREARAAGRSQLWLANYGDADQVLAAADVDGVVLCSSDINPALLDVLIRDEQARDRDLYLDPGLSGIDFRRVQALPIAHQPLLYVQSPSLSRLQVGFKRAFDVTVAIVLLVVLAPLLLGLAAAISAHRPRAGALPPAPGRTRWRGVRDLQVPLDVRRRRGSSRRPARRAERSHRSAVQARPRSPRDAGRPVHPGVQPRRAAAAAQRRPRRHEPRGTAPGAAGRGRRLPARPAGPAPGAPRDHRALAGRGAGQPVVRRLPPPRPVLRRQLVAAARPHHRPRHRRAGPRAPVDGAGRPGRPTTRRRRWARRRRSGFDDLGKIRDGIRRRSPPERRRSPRR